MGVGVSGSGIRGSGLGVWRFKGVGVRLRCSAISLSRCNLVFWCRVRRQQIAFEKHEICSGNLSCWVGIRPTLVQMHGPGKGSLVVWQGQGQLLRRNVKRFRGGLVFEVHRLFNHSTLSSRVKNKKRRYKSTDPKTEVWSLGGTRT